MNLQALSAIDFLRQHRREWNMWGFAGPSRAELRQELMRRLTGKKLPKAKCGINALESELYSVLGLEGCRAAQHRKLFNLIMEGVSA